MDCPEGYSYTADKWRYLNTNVHVCYFVRDKSNQELPAALPSSLHLQVT